MNGGRGDGGREGRSWVLLQPADVLLSTSLLSMYKYNPLGTCLGTVGGGEEGKGLLAQKGRRCLSHL